MALADDKRSKARRGRINRLRRVDRPHQATSTYDSNGNMTKIDGPVCTWDFKDRVVVQENAEMRAAYTDRCITKRVAWKPGYSPSIGLILRLNSFAAHHRRRALSPRRDRGRATPPASPPPALRAGVNHQSTPAPSASATPTTAWRVVKKVKRLSVPSMLTRRWWWKS